MSPARAGLLTRLVQPVIARLVQPVIDRQVRRALSTAETDASFAIGSRAGDTLSDRYPYDREEIQRQALEAWRVNPLARRIVGLTSQYVVGGGVSISCPHPATAAFLRTFWEHPLNRLPVRVYEWCDELTRSGNLFILLTTDASGMSYARAIPAAQVRRILSRPNDLDQETAFEMQPNWAEGEPVAWQVYDPREEQRTSEGTFRPVMLHYAINRPVGAQWGESDLAPALRWLSRYAAWLEDRARLNRFRTAFLYIVRARFTSEAERRARQSSLNAAPPSPGSILVTDENETWDALHPRLESDDAGQDGLALKKMLAAGAGIPMHFLAEPEGSTRTTAEAAGGPTYRHFEQRQRFFLWLLSDLLRAVVNRRSAVDGRISRRAEVALTGADISARDNVSLSMAANNISAVLRGVRDRGLIDDAEFLRLIYRFCGESVDVEEMLARGKTAGSREPSKGVKTAAQPVKVDPETGEEKTGGVNG
ncbi:MAG: hypothetical protein FD147_297 [Chloroflexi bacterium]|nr:MAG: hypothetical protein FD147_297 [Chloroflexota bacterium]